MRLRRSSYRDAKPPDMARADRVVLMRGGHTEQLGTPAELYGCPHTVFAAGFVGTSAMNFADGAIARANGGVALAMADGYAALRNAGTTLDGASFIGGGSKSAFWARLCASATGSRCIGTRAARWARRSARWARRSARRGLRGSRRRAMRSTTGASRRRSRRRIGPIRRRRICSARGLRGTDGCIGH